MTLPLIRLNKKWPVAAASYFVFVALYTLTGNFHLTLPKLLLPSRLDELVPFIGWTVWIYHSQFFFLAFNIAVLKDEINLSRTFYALNLASLLSFLIFIIYPTTIPRPSQPAAGLTMKAFALLYALDSPTNCFPSLHISLAWLAALGVMRESKKLGALVGLWAMLISLSTMTTKQHYLIDIAGGFAVAIGCNVWLSTLGFRQPVSKVSREAAG